MTGDQDFRTVVDSLDTGVALVQIAAGADLRCQYANPAIRRMLEFDRHGAEDELLPLIAARLASSNLVQYVDQAQHNKTSHRVLLAFADGAGASTSLLAQVSPLGSNSVQLILVAAAESILEGDFAIEDVWRAVVNHPSDYLGIIDRNGVLLWLNRTAPGFTFEDVVGVATIYDFIPPDQVETARKALHAVFEEGTSTPYETSIEILDQTFLNVITPVTRDGKIYCACVTSREITQLKRAEQALKASEAHFRSVAESVPDIITLVDTSLTMTYVSHTLHSLPGVRKEDLIEKGCQSSGQPNTARRSPNCTEAS